MSWQDDGIITHHYANRSQYLGSTEPECIEADIELTLNSFQPHPTMTTATIKRIEEKAKSMIGQTYLFMQDKAPHTIQNYDLRNNRLIISSDQRMFNFEAKNALKLMEAFRKVEDPLEETIAFTQPDQEAQDCTEKRIDEALASEAKRKADEIFEGVKAMARGHVPEQPDSEEAPAESEAVDRLEVEVMERLPESEHTSANPKFIPSEGLVKAFSEFSKENAEKEEEIRRSIHVSPCPIALYDQLTPIVRQYRDLSDRLHNFRESARLNRSIFLHNTEAPLDPDFAAEIYTLAIERAQQQMRDTENKFMKIVQEYIQNFQSFH